jgi:murein DD-endopeptidase MepM/ murein hydrolase activator NlpD
MSDKVRNWRRWVVVVLIAKWLLLGAALLAEEDGGEGELLAQRDLLRHLSARPVHGAPKRIGERPGARVGQWLAFWGRAPESSSSGEGSPFLWPLAGYRLTSAYSTRRWHPILASYRPHLGVDLAAPVGTPVVAAGSGTVVFAGWDAGGGNVVKLAHDNGYLTAYLHLERVEPGLAVGRRVAQGEVIGAVGSTGRSTGPHLEYRVSRSGRWIDPLLVMEPSP